MNVYGFADQVGGHFGVFACGGHICKPINSRELAFYEQMGDQFTPFTPKCCGVVGIRLHKDDDDTLIMTTDKPVTCHQMPCSSDDQVVFRLNKSGKVEAERHHNTWAKQCQSKAVKKLMKGRALFLLLENAVTHFLHPCVIDLKMGTRQYGDDADDLKRESQTNKCLESTSATIGVRLVGMQLYQEESGTYFYVNKYLGRKMNCEKFHETLTEYLIRAGKPRAEALLKKLQLLRKRMSDAHGYRFFSSSLLIAFDGEENESNSIDLRMIDFAHSTFSGFFNDVRYAGPDDGYLLGLDSLIASVNDMVDENPT